jgi:hypothetical protein
MNSSRREYFHLGMNFPLKTGYYLGLLESKCGWDLRMDFIYTNHSANTCSYKNVSDTIYGRSEESSGGEIIKEELDLYNF